VERLPLRFAIPTLQPGGPSRGGRLAQLPNAPTPPAEIPHRRPRTTEGDGRGVWERWAREAWVRNHLGMACRRPVDPPCL